MSAASIDAKAPTGKPRSAKKPFSRRRSCATATEAPLGRTTVRAASASSAAAGAFSNSVVTAAQLARELGERRGIGVRGVEVPGGEFRRGRERDRGRAR